MGSTPTWSGRRVRWTAGIALIAIGTAVLVGVLLGERATDEQFEAGQQQLAEAWDAPLIIDPSPPASRDEGSSDAPSPTAVESTPDPSGGQPSTSSPVASQDPVFTPRPLAVLSFRRPGSTTAPVTDQTLYVVDDITEAALTQGPGHYPETSDPGAPGNFAVAGHRTGWGAPFYSLDELAPGDEVVVRDRQGSRFTYVVDRTQIVNPDDAWVLGPDPLGTSQPTLTLTTCDPAGINTNRLVVFGTLNPSDASQDGA